MADVKTEKKFASLETAKKINDDVASLKEDLSTKITKFYASNQGETHLADSDNGKIMDMMLYGKSEQNGTPSPENPVEIKSVVNPTIKVVGKNLLNMTLQTTTHNGVTCANNGDGTYTLNGTSTADTDFYIYGAWNTVNNIPLDSQKTYIIKKSGNKNIQFYTGVPDIYTADASLEDGQIKNQVGISYFICRISSGVTLNNFTIYPQIEEGSVSTDFQPYHEQTVTLPYTLNAILVSSGGNVTIDGQQYVSDYVDVERGKLVQMIGSIEITGDENWEMGFDTWKTYPHCVRCDNINHNIKEGNCLCEKYSTYNKCPNDDTNSVSALYVRNISISDDRFSTVEEFKAEFKRLYNNETPIKLHYQAETPQEIDLTSEEIAAFKQLATYYPITNISISSEQLDGYTVFNYPISMANGWNYVKQQLNDNRDYIYDMDLQSAEAYVNSEYAVALTELEV